MSDQVKSDKIPEMLSWLMANNDVSPASKQGFLTSLTDFHKRKGYLSDRQFIALERMYQNYSVDTSEWKNNFDEVKKKNFKICVDFYSRSKYYGNIVSKALKDTNYIPSEKEYRAICENKYAAVIIREYEAPALYSVGAMVRLRKKPEYGIGNILEVMPVITAAVRGGKTYKVYFSSMERPLEIQERHIANVRDCDLKKMSDVIVS